MRVLPDSLRESLKEPIGRLVKNDDELFTLIFGEHYIVSVGDRVTYTLLKQGITPRLCIVDYLLEQKAYPVEMRQRIQGFAKRYIPVSNPPGCISDELWDAIKSVFSQRTEDPICIEVDGEEDLASLAVIYLAPRDVTVIYGLPNKGVVVVKATATHKQKVKTILDKMM